MKGDCYDYISQVWLTITYYLKSRWGMLQLILNNSIAFTINARY